MTTHRTITIIAAFVAATTLGLGCIQETIRNNNVSICGNGELNPGEQCDDGNSIDHDGCSAVCELEGFCGNAVVEPGEECDDGNYEDRDGCDPLCQTETGCGNGKLEVGEQCDDDNLRDGDGCSALCEDEQIGAICGNAIFELGEGCDDGNTASGDGCGVDCEREDGCGNGTQDATEMCDDGNNVAGDGCSDECRVEFVCGNDYCEEQNYETCYRCPQDCCPDCGDMVLDEGEECDDGNNDDGDGCDKGCGDEDGTPTCGNGIWEATEECEDGNTTIHDGCSDTCTVEFVCGDQICEDTMGETCQRCQMDCCPNCGNGVLEPLQGEECDQSELQGLSCNLMCYTGGNLACTPWCTFDTSQCQGTGPVCGNGLVDGGWCGEECDGTNLDGQTCESLHHDGGTLSCDANCQFDVSSCGALMCLPQNEAIRLVEASHEDPDYFVITNLSVCPTDVAGLEISTEDGTLDYFALPSQILQPGEMVYLVESSGGSGTDINLGYNISWVTSDDGYVLLCDGPCTTPANVIDAVLWGATPPTLPTGVNFQPTAMGDLSSGQGHLRVTYNGVYPNFQASDWTIGAATRP